MANALFVSQDQDDRMTVSLHRTSDATRPTTTLGADDQSLMLPPTLFKLPNLSPDTVMEPKANQSHVVEEQPSQDAAVAEYAPAVQAPSSQAERGYRFDNSSTETASDEPRSRETSTSSPGSRGDVAQSFVDHTIPAGRTWIESIGAHRKVLVLLVAVIAAAVWTSRRSGEPELGIESTLAENGELLQFDNGDFDPGVSLGLSAGQNAKPVTASVPLDAPQKPLPNPGKPFDSVSIESSNVASVVMDNTTSPIAAPAEAASTNVSNEFVAADTAVASLSAPKATAVPDSAAPVDGSASQPTPAIETNRFAVGKVDANIQAASNRSPEFVAKLPTLEDLNDGPRETASRFQPSATPAPVGDWLQYLPADPNKKIP